MASAWAASQSKFQLTQRFQSVPPQAQPSADDNASPWEDMCPYADAATRNPAGTLTQREEQSPDVAASAPDVAASAASQPGTQEGSGNHRSAMDDVLEGRSVPPQAEPSADDNASQPGTEEVSWYPRLGTDGAPEVNPWAGMDDVLEVRGPQAEPSADDAKSLENIRLYGPVSYTHLTLPTKRIV